MTSNQDNNSSNDLWEHYMGKYKNPNPIARFLTDGFFNRISTIVNSLDSSSSVLEVGCGPGESTRRVLSMLDGQTLEASEFEQELVNLHLKHDFPVTIRQESVYELQRSDNEFDCIMLLEVLEHLDDYEKALSEIFRVASKSVIVSVPNEPLWRILNFSRGKYWGDWGNTPGHINHWSSKKFAELVSRYGTILKIYKPIPWTIIHAKVNMT